MRRCGIGGSNRFMYIQDKLLSICITSYNRVNELKRCIESIRTKYPIDIEIVISEDHSEQREIIRSLIEELKKETTIELRFYSNNVNLGYDMNLYQLIALAKGKYILFLSDDDSLVENSLDKYIEILKSDEYNLIFTPFIEGTVIKRYYRSDFPIIKGVESINQFVYDSILFSGLTFRRENIANIEANRFLNCNYFQVYLFMYSMLLYNSNYFNIPMIQCNGDGENAFGKATSSIGNDLLADRKSIYSNLEFHKGLIKVIEIFEKDFSIEIKKSFGKEYSLRAFSGMAFARKQSISTYIRYWKKLINLDISFSSILYLYHFLLLIFGYQISSLLINIPKKILVNYRSKCCE
ncbi:MAG: hypothetical protein CVV46_02915 [Spirochaetae bacterium HGW-Spirochaetae-2]|jgi:glycosyltransferase involved in cell wall biosynthesis|nr:MAG: hypothetical protein CVV46_02915 [Spirochaetae bacterium HGW-Spirochaetae-2]